MPESTDFLYPFIEGDETDSDSLLEDLSQSARGKWDVSSQLRAATLAGSQEMLAEVARLMAERFSRGGRLFAFGNGGSATDAEGVAQLYTHPPAGPERVRALPARSLAEDQAVITALSNDVGFDKVFSRQLIAHGRPDDVAIGYSTSGNSENLMVAFAEAAKQGMLTVGLAGYEGGQMAREPTVAYCLVARSDSVHRIQEAQAALTHALWAQVQAELAAGAGAAA